MSSWQRCKQQFFSFGYRRILKPLFFRFDPETVHQRMTRFGHRLGTSRFLQRVVATSFLVADPRLKQQLFGLLFPNPVGLGAGYDKTAQLTSILPAVGFGFMEVGSITAVAYEGNPKPRLYRLPAAKSLVVNFGLSGPGAQAMAKRLAGIKAAIPLGISIARSNVPETASVQAGIADQLTSYRLLHTYGDYITLNISCPNTCGGEPFHDPLLLDELLSALQDERTDKPILLKISPDLAPDTVRRIAQLAQKYHLSGIIAGNLTKDRHRFQHLTLPPGGLSGQPTAQKSNRLIRQLWEQADGRFVIIGCGGIFSAEDAYEKLRLGASLVQLVTGLIYEGPQLVGQINSGLLKLMERDGFQQISEITGSAYR